MAINDDIDNQEESQNTEQAEQSLDQPKAPQSMVPAALAPNDNLPDPLAAFELDFQADLPDISLVKEDLIAQDPMLFLRKEPVDAINTGRVAAMSELTASMNAEENQGSGLPIRTPENSTRPFVSIGRELELDNLEFVGTTDVPYQIEVRDLNDPAQPLIQINVAEVAESQGINLAEVDFSYNFPETAVNQTPKALNQAELAKLSLGDPKGVVNFLTDSNKFEAIDFDPEKGIVVREEGVWKQLDPGFVDGIKRIAFAGNPLKMSRELTNAIARNADLGLFMVGTGLGASAGRVAGPIAGAAAGSVAGPKGSAVGGAIGKVAGPLAGSAAGGYASGMAKGLLGRYFGTFDGDDEEMIKNAQFDALLALGGQGVAMGGGWTGRQLLKAAQKVASKGGGALGAVHSGVFGHFTKTKGKFGTMVNNVAPIQREVARKEVKNLSANEAKAFFKNENLKAMNQLLDTANKGFNKRFGDMLGKIHQRAEGRNLTINFKEAIPQMSKSLENGGFGKIVQKRKTMQLVSFNASKNGGFEKIVQKGKKMQFVPFNASERLAREAAGQPVISSMGPESVKMLNRVIADIGKDTSSLGVRRGAQASKAIADINARIRSIASQSGAQEPTTQAAIKKAAGALREGFTKNYDQVGLGPAYKRVLSTRRAYDNELTAARNALSDPSKAETFLNQVLAQRTSKIVPQNQARRLVGLAGPQGEKLFKNMVIKDLAGEFAPWMVENPGLFTLGKLFAGGRQILTGDVVGGAALVGGAVFSASPRAQLMKVGATKKAGAALSKSTTALMRNTAQASAYLRSLTPKQLEQFTSNPANVEALYRNTIFAGQRALEDATNAAFQNYQEDPINEILDAQ